MSASPSLENFVSTQHSTLSLRRRIFSLPTLLSLAVAVAFLIFLVSRFDVDLDATRSHVARSNPWYLALAFVVHYTTLLFRGIRWRLLLRNSQGDAIPTPGILYFTQLILLGWFANSVSWFRLGDAYRAYLYHDEHGASFSRTMGTILAERLVDTVIVVLLLLLAVPFLVTSDRGTSWTVLEIATGISAILLLALLTMMWTRRWVVNWLPARLSEKYERFQEGSASSFKRVPEVALWGLLGWMAEVARLYLVILALGLDLNFALAIFAALASSLLTLVPTPGGFGAVESGTAGLLARLSTLTTSAIAALVIVDRSISYVSIIICGGALFIVRQIRRQRRPSPHPSVIEGA